jgi:phosphatidate phosphatase
MFSSHFLIAVFSIPLMVIIRWISISIPYAKTGFFCDDDEIRHPLKEDTIKGHLMFGIFSILSLITICLTEISLIKHLSKKNKRVYRIPGRLLSPFFENFLYLFACLILGDLATSALTNIGKRTMSRPRPSFLDACKPDLNISCPSGSHIFVEDYICYGKNDPDEYFSFPSGHSSHSVYFGIMMIVYLQKRCKIIPPFRAILQLFFAMLVFFICASRVRDFKHRLSDVAGGAFVGSIVAFFFLTQVINFFNDAKYETTDQERGYSSLDDENLLPQIVITAIDETPPERKGFATPTSEYGSVVVSD